MTEEEVVEVINRILSTLSYNFKFGYFGVDDMKQEGWVYAIEALPKYNPEIAPLENFLRTHIRNRFLNLKRDKLSRHQPPCPSCPFYDPECRLSINKCSAFEDKSECDKWSGWEKRNSAKKNLVQPLDITNIRDEREKNMKCSDDIVQHSINVELIKIIDKNLPISMRSDFNKMLEGIHVAKQKREKIEVHIQNIIQEYYDGETWEDV
ncbi:hypothetical protein CL634_05005 [bacterium]|nr:hypothetical protein [bacterium]|tara:strand:+ start:1219 stop:1842 length:624 start_codon:yes stop_codon:yes gene_type:complete